MDGTINIRNYPHKFIKVRQNMEGGGVAVILNKKVKAVHLKQYEIDNLEAVWVDAMLGKVRTVIGSVYIPPGDISALDKLYSVIGQITQSHSQLIIGMDSNSRSSLWDDTCIGISQSQRSAKMGSRLEEIINNHALHVHNSGVATYRSGNCKSAPDVTLSSGISKYGKVSWAIICDELKTPHEGIVIDIGDRDHVERKEVINWKCFDWPAFTEESSNKLQHILDNWHKDLRISCDDMVSQLTQCIQKCVGKVAEMKVVSSHS